LGRQSASDADIINGYADNFFDVIAANKKRCHGGLMVALDVCVHKMVV